MRAQPCPCFEELCRVAKQWLQYEYLELVLRSAQTAHIPQSLFLVAWLVMLIEQTVD